MLIISRLTAETLALSTDNHCIEIELLSCNRDEFRQSVLLLLRVDYIFKITLRLDNNRPEELALADSSGRLHKITLNLARIRAKKRADIAIEASLDIKIRYD